MRKKELLLAALLAAAGLCALLWPVFTGHRLQANTDEAAQSFLEERKLNPYPELLVALQDYNRQLYAEKQRDLSSLEALSLTYPPTASRVRSSACWRSRPWS